MPWKIRLRHINANPDHITLQTPSFLRRYPILYNAGGDPALGAAAGGGGGGIAATDVGAVPT